MSRCWHLNKNIGNRLNMIFRLRFFRYWWPKSMYAQQLRFLDPLPPCTLLYALWLPPCCTFPFSLPPSWKEKGTFRMLWFNGVWRLQKEKKGKFHQSIHLFRLETKQYVSWKSCIFYKNSRIFHENVQNFFGKLFFCAYVHFFIDPSAPLQGCRIYFCARNHEFWRPFVPSEK